MKRCFDIAFTCLVLVAGAPVFLAIALLIKLTSPGPVLYSHRRVGLQGKPFGCLKFRTMHANAEERLAVLLSGNEGLLHEWNTYYKLKEDPRITPFGKWLRSSSLDELPQFFNVLKGDMSLVGPRPLTQDEVTRYLGDKAGKILSVRPGLTSIWTTRGRNQFTLKERIRLEMFYIDRQSFWLDLRLIARTIVHMIFPRGAY